MEDEERVLWADSALGASATVIGHEYIGGIQYAVPLKSPIFDVTFEGSCDRSERQHVESLAVQLNLLTYKSDTQKDDLWSDNDRRNDTGEWEKDWRYTLHPVDLNGNELDYLVRHRFLVEVTEQLCNEASGYRSMDIDESLIGGYVFMDQERMRWLNARPTVWPDEHEVQEAIAHCLLTNGLTGKHSIFPRGADLILYGSSMQMNMFVASRDISYTNENRDTKWRLVQPKRAYSQRHYSTISNPPRGMLFDNQELSTLWASDTYKEVQRKLDE